MQYKPFKSFSNTIAKNPAILKAVSMYSAREYSQFLLVLRETLAGFNRHNVLGLSASLSFYTLLALIPLILLLFYLLSYLVFTSDDAIVKLAIITGNILPDYSAKIMSEVYKASHTKSAWGIFGLLILLWSVTPLASAMRKTFLGFSATSIKASFFHSKVKDVIAVLGILLIFFTFTTAGFLLEEALTFFSMHLPDFSLNYFSGAVTLSLTSILLAGFYSLFFPQRMRLKHLLIGGLLTAFLWLLMRPAFEVFLSLNPHFGAMFGSMKNLFISITWLYINFAAFLLGAILISTLAKHDALLLKHLFDDTPDKSNYLATLIRNHGTHYNQGDYVYRIGNVQRQLYYLASGEITLTKDNTIVRTIQAGQFFGEGSSFSHREMQLNALVSTANTAVIAIPPDTLETVLTEHPGASLFLLKSLAQQHDTY